MTQRKILDVQNARDQPITQNIAFLEKQQFAQEHQNQLRRNIDDRWTVKRRKRCDLFVIGQTLEL